MTTFVAVPARSIASPSSVRSRGRTALTIGERSTSPDSMNRIAGGKVKAVMYEPITVSPFSVISTFGMMWALHFTLNSVTMLALVVFGVVALTQLDTDEFPDVQQPVVAVAVPYPGASPDTVEREVINPIEEAISGISGVDQVMSNSLDSFGNIIVIFVFQKDVQQATHLLPLALGVAVCPG